jgi:5-methylcytosine-specific restriction endonuclease McrA
MPTKASERNYQAEAAKESPARKEERRERQRARYAYEKKHGDLPTNVQVDHIKPLSGGGKNVASNLRAIPKKKNESFNRRGPGGNQIGKA